MDVFLLWHIHNLSDSGEDAKLIGVYASAADTEAARVRVMSQPGFRDMPAGFTVDRYTVGQNHWTSGFVTAPAEDTTPASA